MTSLRILLAVFLAGTCSVALAQDPSSCFKGDKNLCEIVRQGVQDNKTKLPYKMGNMTYVDAIANGTNVIHKYEVNYSLGSVSKKSGKSFAQLTDIQKHNVSKSVCGDHELKTLIGDGITITYEYHYTDGETTKFTVSHCPHS